LTLVVGLVFPLFAWYGYDASQWIGVAAAGVAAATCWCGALVALVLGWVFGQGDNAVGGILAGMAFRIGLPLIVGVALDRRGGPLAEAGVFGMILCYYLVTLSVETLLAVRLKAAVKKQADVTENM
jgi:hypothetical protein